MSSFHASQSSRQASCPYDYDHARSFWRNWTAEMQAPAVMACGRRLIHPQGTWSLCLPSWTMMHICGSCWKGSRKRRTGSSGGGSCGGRSGRRECWVTRAIEGEAERGGEEAVAVTIGVALGKTLALNATAAGSFYTVSEIRRVHVLRILR
ncbi:hypothetical protein B296_00002026 [Ensete ventricosum]|uniref:Uncharacterized protein n=1 Tax=Ensete ventricosum TaxID=4639 RepID=A0A427BBX0_ENSVE|nr:hypothetical protein B296_00002026 [Ensete ventricosum]